MIAVKMRERFKMSLRGIANSICLKAKIPMAPGQVAGTIPLTASTLDDTLALGRKRLIIIELCV